MPEPSPASRAAAEPPAGAARGAVARGAWWRRTACVVLAVGALASVALYNGYPLVWWDSGAYVQSAFLLDLPASRPIFYSLFLLAAQARLTLWIAVLVQSLLVVFLLGLILDEESGDFRLGARRDLALLGTCLVLAGGTALPWIGGQIMADVFTAIVALSLYYVLFARPGARRLGAVAALLVLSLPTHFGHPPMVLAVLVAVHAAARLGVVRLRPGAVRLAWACLAGAIVLLPLTNWLLAGRVLSGGAHAILVGRLLRDGVVHRLLAEHCATRAYALCAHADALPHALGPYLWQDDSAFHKIGGWEGSAPESWRIVRDAVTAYPLDVLRGTLRATAAQLHSVETGHDLIPYLDGTAIHAVIRHHLPHEYARYRAARQQRGTLPGTWWNALHDRVLVAGVVASLVAMIVALWRGDARGARLHVFVWLTVLASALVVGATAEPNPRYGARLMWLVPFAVLASVAGRSARAPRRPSSPARPGDARQ